MFLSVIYQLWIQGKGPGDPLPPIFFTKLTPEGPKKDFLRPPLPPPYHRVWMTETPLYLKVWIRHCICYQYRKLIFNEKSFSINPKHDNNTWRDKWLPLIQCYGWPLCFSWKLMPNCQSLLRWKFRFLWVTEYSCCKCHSFTGKEFLTGYAFN